MTRSPKRLLIGLLALVLCTLATPLWAQSDTDKKRASQLFDEGKLLLDDKKYAAACAKFEESYELVKGVGSQYFLARCLTKLGKTATAYRHFGEVAEISARVGQQERADVAKQRMAELEPKLMRIQVDVARRVPGLRIDCDGVEIPESGWGQALPYDPGSHVVTATLDGASPWTRTVELTQEGDVRTLVVPDLNGVEETPGGSSDIDGVFVAGLAVGGLGIIGVGIGGALAGIAKSTYDDSDEFCDATGCDQDGLDLVSDARGLGDGATAMFIVGGVLLAGGVTMVVISMLGDEEEQASAVPLIELGPTAARLRWRF